MSFLDEVLLYSEIIKVFLKNFFFIFSSLGSFVYCLVFPGYCGTVSASITQLSIMVWNKNFPSFTLDEYVTG